MRVSGPRLIGGGFRVGAHWGGIGKAAGQPGRRETGSAVRGFCAAGPSKIRGSREAPRTGRWPQVEGLRPEDGPAGATSGRLRRETSQRTES